MSLFSLLAFSRLPGNALSFWIRQTLRWSRGCPALPHEPKDNLFAYLGPAAGAAEAREGDLCDRYRLHAFARASTRFLYRKNLYLLDLLERAAGGLPMPEGRGGPLKAMDVGAQDWHYVVALEKWLRFHAFPEGRDVALHGIELDGYGVYSDFRSRRDYALAHAAQTGNPGVRYEIGDFLRCREGGQDLITMFYPFVTRRHLLLWGLPLRFFAPGRFLSQAAALTRPGGWLLVFCHTLREHEIFLGLGMSCEGYRLLREGGARSNLVDFHEQVGDRRFSVWERL